MKDAVQKDLPPRYGLTPVVFVCGGVWITIGLILLLVEVGLRLFNWLFSG
jgi:hypothetical protein